MRTVPIVCTYIGIPSCGTLPADWNELLWVGMVRLRRTSVHNLARGHEAHEGASETVVPTIGTWATIEEVNLGERSRRKLSLSLTSGIHSDTERDLIICEEEAMWHSHIYVGMTHFSV